VRYRRSPIQEAGARRQPATEGAGGGEHRRPAGRKALLILRPVTGSNKKGWAGRGERCGWAYLSKGQENEIGCQAAAKNFVSRTIAAGCAVKGLRKR